jgi:hypothetical protein
MLGIAAGEEQKRGRGAGEEVVPRSQETVFRSWSKRGRCQDG